MLSCSRSVRKAEMWYVQAELYYHHPVVCFSNTGSSPEYYEQSSDAHVLLPIL